MHVAVLNETDGGFSIHLFKKVKCHVIDCEDKAARTLSYADKFTLYAAPDGWLVVPSGNQRATVSREDMQELVDYLLEYACKFEEHKETEA